MSLGPPRQTRKNRDLTLTIHEHRGKGHGLPEVRQVRDPVPLRATDPGDACEEHASVREPEGDARVGRLDFARLCRWDEIASVGEPARGDLESQRAIQGSGRCLVYAIDAQHDLPDPALPQYGQAMEN